MVTSQVRIRRIEFRPPLVPIERDVDRNSNLQALVCRIERTDIAEADIEVRKKRFVRQVDLGACRGELRCDTENRRVTDLSTPRQLLNGR